jgi:transposase InsO family protein
MSASESQGQIHENADIQRLCRLGGVSRAGYYRSFEINQPARADADMRDQIQRISLAHRHYGYRRIAASMSRVANPYDNAKAESFMKTLKAEEVNAKTYATLEDVRRQIGAFIETVYNVDRLHSALAYKPPAEFEAELNRSRKPQPKVEVALSPF